MSDLVCSVISCSYRPGGADILLAGMRDQTLPRDQWEVIWVDHRYERRHDKVMDLAKAYGVTNLLHVPEHRRNGRWGCTSSAFNTGFALARGRVVIMLVDWTYAPPGWLEAHLKHHQGRSTYVAAPYLYHAVGITQEMHTRLAGEFGTFGHIILPWEMFTQQPPLKLKIPFDLSTQDDRANGASAEEDAVLRGEVFDEISVFEEGLFDPKWLPRMPPIPANDPGMRNQIADSSVVHLKNESVRRFAVYKLNGTDIWSERGGRMAIDTEFGMRVACSGIPFVWDPAALAHCVNPRHGVCRTMPFGEPLKRLEGRWNLADCVAFAKRRSGEVKAGKFLAAPAPYTMEGLAAKLEPWRTADVIDTSGLDVPDTEFFGREVWPDSLY